MQTNLTWLLVLQHLALSLIPWLMVMLAGGGLGILFAFLMHRWFQHHPSAFDLMVFFPWRSIAIYSAFVICHSSLMNWNFRLPPVITRNSDAAGLLILFVPWVAYAVIQSWYPASKQSRLFSIVRTFTILSLILPVFLQTAGMGYFIYMAAYWFNVKNVTLGYVVVGCMVLTTDLIIGAVQFFVCRWERKSQYVPG